MTNTLYNDSQKIWREKAEGTLKNVDYQVRKNKVWRARYIPQLLWAGVAALISISHMNEK